MGSKIGDIGARQLRPYQIAGLDEYIRRVLANVRSGATVTIVSISTAGSSNGDVLTVVDGVAEWTPPAAPEVDELTLHNAAGVLEVMDGGIDTLQLADGGVTWPKISGAGVGLGDVPYWNAGVWAFAQVVGLADYLAHIALKATDVILGHVRKGNGVTIDATTAALSVNVDGSTTEISGDNVRVKDGGITNAKLGSDVKVGSLAALTTTDKDSVVDAINEVAASVGGSYTAGDALTLTGTDFDVNVDNTTIEVSSDALRVKDGGVTAAKLATDSVSTAKIIDSNVTWAKISGSGLSLGDVPYWNSGSWAFGQVVGLSDYNTHIATKASSSVLGHVKVGDGLEIDGSGVLSANVDDATINIAFGDLQVKNDGITNGKLAADVKVGSLAALNTTDKTDVVSAINEVISESTYAAGDGITIAGTTIAADVDNATIETSAGELRVKAAGITASHIADGTVTNAEMATDVKIGSLAGLNTTDKDSVTDAINEVVASAAAIKPRLLVDYVGGSASASNNGATDFAAVSDPGFRRIVNLTGINTVRILGKLNSNTATGTRIRVQYHTSDDPTVSSADSGWTELATTAGSHPNDTLFYSAALSVPSGAQIANCQIRVGIYGGDGVADPSILYCSLNFYQS